MFPEGAPPATVPGDVLLLKVLKKSGPNMLVPWWLMAGIAYELEDMPILSDYMWDWLCRTLQEYELEVTHFHEHLVDWAGLSTGTAKKLHGVDIPLRLECGLKTLRRTLRKRR